MTTKGRGAIKLLVGDVVDRLKEMPGDNYDAMLTDPPYGLEFMNKGWDKVVPGVEVWSEVLRVLKPGAFALVFGGTRTFHRLAVALEDAGFELRDTLMWVYGSGFPKSLDVSKAIDKAAGAEREVIGPRVYADGTTGHYAPMHEGYERPFTERMVAEGAPKLDTRPATPEAERWQGYGTSLKPAYEPILLVRKPTKLTYAQTALEHGCGALNIDGARIPTTDTLSIGSNNRSNAAVNFGMKDNKAAQGQHSGGRWPANLIHDGSDEVTELFPNDAARFFYCAKASKSERSAGVERNAHPTVKPLALTEYLAKLLLPPEGGNLLVPFSGSGSEAIGAMRAGWTGITLIEREQEYMQIARDRLMHEIDKAA